MRYLTALIVYMLLLACQDAAPPPATAATEDPLTARAEAGLERLRATPAGTLVANAIAAHGGLDTWYAQSPLYFRFNYRPVDSAKTVRDSYILNDYVNARAVHRSATDEGITYGFDGTEAWRMPAEAEIAIKPRFWSLTPYYFVGLPFVLADEGINFEQLPDSVLQDQNYHRVRVTYGAGTGDAPDDYYVLWLNPETKQLDALNYIVSYPGFFPDGGHLPEKLMVLNGKTTVDGIALPTGYTTRWSDAPEKVITNITVSDYAFRPDTESSAFDRPRDAGVVNDMVK